MAAVTDQRLSNSILRFEKLDTDLWRGTAHMGKRNKQLTFKEFGQRFMQHAMTPEIIRASLAKIVPEEQQLIITSPTTVTIHTRTMIEDIVQLPDASEHDELVFDVPLAIHLTLGVDLFVGQEQYTALAATRLRLTARLCSPLMMWIDCAPVEPEQITVTSEGQDNRFDLVKRFGLLDPAIRQQVAEITNQHIQRSQRQRRIDVRKLITEFVEGVSGNNTHPAGAVQPRKRPPSRDRSMLPLPAEELSERVA
jgi:hypothetical protein